MHIMISLLLAGESTLYVATSLLNLKRQLIAGVAYVHSQLAAFVSHHCTCQQYTDAGIAYMQSAACSIC